jgi:protein SCO1/2
LNGLFRKFAEYSFTEYPMTFRLRLLVPLAIFTFALAWLAVVFHFGPLKGPEKVNSQGSSEVLIGGPFTLTQSTGARVSDHEFRGKFMLVYFGFTYCPDVCPNELQGISRALDLLGDKINEVAPLFITIDPARDTPKIMAAYLTHFHENILGLTGSPDDIAHVAKAYRIYYRKVENAERADQYSMDHTSYIYWMDRQGRYVRHFTAATPPDDMARAMREDIAKMPAS